MVILMMHHLTGGAWGTVIRPFLETATRTLPVLALLFLPLLLGLADVYPWARWTPEQIRGSKLLEHKSVYLNETAFIVRAVVYLGVWVALALLLTRGAGPEAEGRRATLSGPGLVLYGLTVTFASIDWIMSLDPLWYSTIFGMLLAGGQVLAGMAFAILCLVLVLRAADTPVPRGPLHDVGNLLLAMVMMWAYLAFSQFLLIWCGNLPEETTWYVKRLQGGWQVLGILLIVAQFMLPFFMLLSRDLKREPRGLALVAGVVLVMRVVDLYWMVTPSYFPHQEIRLHWMDLAALVGLGGLVLACFLHLLQGRDVLPPPETEVSHG
jgi:hypothetical protein